MIKGKTTLITGGAKGIGRAVAVKFASLGANIALNYRSNVDEDLKEEIASFGVECLCIQADVSDFKQAEALIQQTKERFGTLDIIVNNAGITKDMLLLRMKEEEFDDVLNTNLKGTFNVIRHATGILLKQRSGAIINMSSVVGEVGNAGQANYAASKAGVIGLTKAVAKELASRGITCNAIAPGFIETDMTAKLSQDAQSKMLQSIPLGRFGKADEVAALAAFLAENTYITGQVINVDGGMVMN